MLKQKPVLQLDSSSDEYEEDDAEETMDVNQDSGIEREDSSSDDDSDEDEEDVKVLPVSKKVSTKLLNNLEAQKEIIKHLRSKAVPSKPRPDTLKTVISKANKK